MTFSSRRDRRRGPLRGLLAFGLLTGIALLVVAAAVLRLQPTATAIRAAGVVPRAWAPTLREPAPHVSEAPRRWVAAPPIGVRVKTLAVDAHVVPVRVDRSGQLQVPDLPTSLGWWQAGARPGAQTGTVVIVGHVDSATRGLGALFHLDRLTMGSPIIVETSIGSVAYWAVARRAYRKDKLPAEVFATTGLPRLVLITCGGRFNKATRHYADNLVVYAVPAKRHLVPAPQVP